MEKAAITGIECATNQAIAHCVPDATAVTKEFLFYLVKSLQPLLISLGQGGAQPNISQTLLKHLLVAVPPLPNRNASSQQSTTCLILLSALNNG